MLSILRNQFFARSFFLLTYFFTPFVLYNPIEILILEKYRCGFNTIRCLCSSHRVININSDNIKYQHGMNLTMSFKYTHQDGVAINTKGFKLTLY